MKNYNVSVILPVRNGGKYLAEAIESILNQTFTDFEFIIINDGSTDNTEKIINKYSEKDGRIVYLKHDMGKGLVAALNYGIKESSGKYIARMDADDISIPTRFEKQVDFLDRNPECIVVGSAVLAIDSDGMPLYHEWRCTEHKDILITLIKGRGGLAHPSVMMRKSALERVGGYPDSFPVEDLDLWFRMAKIGKFANINEELLKYRYHSGTVGKTKYKEQSRQTAALLDNAQKDFADILPEDFKRLSFPLPMTEAETYIYWSKRACYDGFYKSARKHAFKALRMNPSSESLKALSRAMLYSVRLKKAAD